MPKSSKIYSIDEIRSIIHAYDKTLKDQYKVLQFYLFGSYARGEQTPESDIDLLIEPDDSMDMFDFVNLKEYLEEILGKNVDLGTARSLKPFIKDQILKEAIAL